MILLAEDDPDQGLVVPDGLSVAEAADLRCDLWTLAPDGLVRAPGCEGVGHYLCRSCASHEPSQVDAGTVP